MHETEQDAWAATRRSLERRQEEEPTATRRGWGCLFWSAVAPAVVLIPVIILSFVVAPFAVMQDWMAPTIDPGDWVLVDKLTPRISDYARGDVVLVKEESQGIFSGSIPAHLARIIGQPGDTLDLDNGTLYLTPPDGLRRRVPQRLSACPFPDINPCETHWVLEVGQYFAVFDNPPAPSHFLQREGPIRRENLVGRMPTYLTIVAIAYLCLVLMLLVLLLRWTSFAAGRPSRRSAESSSSVDDEARERRPG